MDVVIKADYDAIVVGSGPGGATVARELACRGKRVLILEWGPGGEIRGTAAQYFSQSMVPGRSMLLTPELVGMVRGITTGGSSLFYCGTAYPAPLDMMRKYGVDLATEVQETRDDLPIAPLKPEMVTPMTSRLMAGARQIGLDWQLLDKFMYQDRWAPGYPAFGWYGDPNHMKWSARMYVDEAVAHGAVLLNGARVTRVLGNMQSATGVEYTINGQAHRVSANQIVIAAGGIGSPVILRQSGIREAGYNYFFDPLITVCGTLKDVSQRDNEIPMSTGAHLRDEGYMMTDLAIPPAMHMAFTAQVLHLNRLFSFRHTARIMVKIKDDLGGHLTDSGGVRKKLTAADRGKLKAGFENARRVLKAAGATDIYKTGILAAHPGGTAKIGEVVDANLKTRIDNLYVCDCSVIPEAWGLPPTFTLVALGKRLARHLVGGQRPAAQQAAT
jgi:choline dehydrogenase-like flavoprotein